MPKERRAEIIRFTEDQLRDGKRFAEVQREIVQRYGIKKSSAGYIVWATKRALEGRPLKGWPKGNLKATPSPRGIGGEGGVEAPEIEEDPHSELKRKVKDIGGFLKRWAKSEFNGPFYRHDVVWKKDENAPLIDQVFEIQHKGNLQEALLRLKDAHDNWRAKVFLVITDERDKEKAQHLVSPFLKGALHELGGQLTVLTKEEIQRLYSFFDENKDLLREIL